MPPPTPLASLDEAVTCAFTNGHIRRAVALGRGIIYLASPVSNGKTTLAHTILRPPVVDTERLSVVGIERTLEVINDGIRPYEVAATETDADAVRAVARAGVDLLFLGEVRREEAARALIAVSLAGHQILTTVHTESAPGAILRLLNWKLAPHDVAASTSLVVCQRLLKRVCLECGEPVEVSPQTLQSLGFLPEEYEGVSAARSRGCRLCGDTGISGRAVIWETLPLTDEVRAMISRGGPALERDLRLQGIAAGMTPLRRGALDLAARGDIPLGEVEQFSPLTDEETALWRSVHRDTTAPPTGE